MEKLDGVLDGNDVAGLFFVDLVHQGGKRRGFPAPGWPGDQHDSRLQQGRLGKLGWQIQCLEIGNLACNHAHDDRAASSLCEYIHAEAGYFRQAVGNITGAFQAQLLDSVGVMADQVSGDPRRVLGVQHTNTGDFELRELAADLDLWCPAVREDQVADFPRGAKHGGDDRRRWYGRCGYGGLRDRGRGRCWWRWLCGTHRTLLETRLALARKGGPCCGY